MIPQTEPLIVLSLGAGVQSSTLYFMCEHGIIPRPEAAIFADTQDEPAQVYKWLAWLEQQSSIPIIRVSVGKLSMASTAVRMSAAGGYLKPSLPVFFDREGRKGKGYRHCTADFKITPILRAISGMRGTRNVIQYMGISKDEATRVSADPKPYIRNVYPLIDLGMTREDCKVWMRDHNYPTPPRSACKYCPFHSDDEWLRLKAEEPNEFAEVVAFEKRYQKACAATRLDGIPYLHDSRKPLEEVEFVKGKNKDAFSNECRGMCNV